MDFEKRYEVVVAGGGVAGVAAALACARAGLSTALIEKTVLVGGLATTGLINYYLPLCDGCGHQVIYGIAEELLHLSLLYGPGDVPQQWRSAEPKAEGGRYAAPFAPASFVLALDEVLEQAGVDLWLDTLVCLPVMEGRRITGLEVENKSGRGALHARVVIDATGDADVAFRAGAPCVEAGNWLSVWATQISLAHARRAVEQPEGVSLLEMLRLGASADGAGMPEGMEKLYGTDGAQVTRFVLESHRLLREHFRAKQEAEGRAAVFPLTLPAMAQFRTTRRILGQVTLQPGEDGLRREDAIGLAPDWRRPGPVWEIPYGSLIPQGVEGLLVAGRCIASEGDAWEVTRVIPPAALTGEVAGLAAATALRAGVTPERLSAANVQQVLARRGIPYHIEDVIR